MKLRTYFKDLRNGDLISFKEVDSAEQYVLLLVIKNSRKNPVTWDIMYEDKDGKRYSNSDCSNQGFLFVTLP